VSGGAAANERVAIVVKGYPRLSETFIAQELLTLQQQGLAYAIYSMRRPYDHAIHPVHAAIDRPVHYLPEYLYQQPWRVVACWWRVRRRVGYATALRVWLKDLRRDLTAGRIRRFGQAIVLAAEMPDSIGWIHVHYLHTPASVARYAALIRDLDWSCSAHAKDIYTIPKWEKMEKLEAMQWLVTCTRANVEHLRGLGNGSADKVGLVYHGCDFSSFPPPAEHAHRRDGTDPADPVVLLSVGRAVPKKGYDILLDALARLPGDLNWRFVHIGAGSQRRKLQWKTRRLGLSARVTWRGAKAREEVFDAYRRADLFVLASRIAPDGDRDGLPNVLLEAQAQELACLSTDVSAIPELIANGENGILVKPAAPDALAQALQRLIRDPLLRRRLGQAGARRVRESFSHAQNATGLIARFQQVMARAP
jgi:glycosyltransferase involved in cell wall biosynthesis